MIGPSALAREFWEHGRVADCPIYDMHGHMGPWYGIHFPRAHVEDMVRTLDECGVRLLVFSHHDAICAPDVGNTLAVDAVRRYPQRLRAYCVVNPNYPDRMAAEIETFSAYRDVYVGFKLHGSWHNTPLTADAYRPVWEYANAHELLVLCHTWGGVENTIDGVGVIREIVSRYPRVRLLLGHSLFGVWDEAASLVSEHPNVYLELTAVLSVRGPLERLVCKADSHKLLFGTDLPWFDPHQGVGAILSADISDEDRHNILHRNAEKLLAPLLPADMLRPNPAE